MQDESSFVLLLRSERQVVLPANLSHLPPSPPLVVVFVGMICSEWTIAESAALISPQPNPSVFLYFFLSFSPRFYNAISRPNSSDLFNVLNAIPIHSTSIYYTHIRSFVRSFVQSQVLQFYRLATVVTSTFVAIVPNIDPRDLLLFMESLAHKHTHAPFKTEAKMVSQNFCGRRKFIARLLLLLLPLLL